MYMQQTPVSWVVVVDGDKLVNITVKAIEEILMHDTICPNQKCRKLYVHWCSQDAYGIVRTMKELTHVNASRGVKLTH